MINKNVVVMICCCMLMTTGCSSDNNTITEDVADQTASIVIEDASENLEKEVENNQPTVNKINEEEQEIVFGETTVLEGDYAYWPTDKISDVPEFMGGVMTSTLMKADEVIIISYDKCDLEYIKNYLLSLETMGYTREKSIETENDLLVTFSKGIRELQLSYSSQVGDGNVTILIRNKEIVDASN